MRALFIKALLVSIFGIVSLAGQGLFAKEESKDSEFKIEKTGARFGVYVGPPYYYSYRPYYYNYYYPYSHRYAYYPYRYYTHHYFY